MMKKLFASEDGGTLSFVIKLAIVIAVIALIIAEVGPIVWIHVSTMQEADDVASGVAFAYKTSGSTDTGTAKAAEMMKLMGYSDAEILESHVEYLPAAAGPRDKTEVKVTVVRNAKTILTSHISFMKKWSRVTTSRTASVSDASSK
jgi:ABC-type glycerol-3-phosphate transport system permease component